MRSDIDHDGVVADSDAVSGASRGQTVTGRSIDVGEAQRYAAGAGGLS